MASSLALADLGFVEGQTNLFILICDIEKDQIRGVGCGLKLTDEFYLWCVLLYKFLYKFYTQVHSVFIVILWA